MIRLSMDEITLAKARDNLLGHTLLSRLSVTFANALAVGMLTVRVEIAACINCRPLPFQKGELNNQANLLFKGIKDMLSVIFRKKIKQKSGYNLHQSCSWAAPDRCEWHP